MLFRRGDKEYLVAVANKLTILGLTAVGLSMVGAMVFVTDVLFGPWAALAVGTIAGLVCTALWAVLPLARRRKLERRERGRFGKARRDHAVRAREQPRLSNRPRISGSKRQRLVSTGERRDQPSS